MIFEKEIKGERGREKERRKEKKREIEKKRREKERNQEKRREKERNREKRREKEREKGETKKHPPEPFQPSTHSVISSDMRLICTFSFPSEKAQKRSTILVTLTWKKSQEGQI